MNLLEAVAANALPDSPALQTGATVLSYNQLFELVEQARLALLAADVTAGDRIGVLLPNGAAHVVAILAIGAVDAIAVPSDPRAGAERLARITEETAPRLTLCEPGAVAATGSASIGVSLGRDPTDSIDLRFTPTSDSGEPPESTRPSLPTSTADNAVIRFTSGSTGRPKGVVLDRDQLVATARLVSELFGLTASHRELVVTPISHSGGWQRVAGTLIGGGCVVFPDEPFSVPGMLEDALTFEATGFFAPPPVIRLLLASGARAARGLAACRTIEVGSASLSGAELAALLELVPEARVFFHYGLTECSRALVLDARAHPSKLDTVGLPAPGVEIDIRGDGGQSLSPGEVGEVFLRGPQRIRSYWQRPDLDASRLTDGWLATGDYGRLDADGFLNLLGRRDDRIESAGYSFFPAEVEAELGSVDGVREYLVAGVPDPRGILGDVPWAFVVPAEAGKFDARAFAKHAQAKLPAYMVPRKVIAVPELPLTASGKPDRRAAVERHSDAAGGGNN
ncbi:MAG: class I adenylate-forming enzyme family protein [Myxococcota bacterium]|nr:class I adenylate-forming enzyme family protein [Myxococcota bacterium]